MMEPSHRLWSNSRSHGGSTKDGCFSRIPYSSLIAFVMCFIGVVLFSVMMVWSFNATVEQVRRIMNITDIPWLDKVYILFFITAFLMAVVAFSLLSIGALSTGSTREEVYKRISAQRSGRISCVVAIVLSFFLNILWTLLVALTAILSFIYFVFSQLCSALPDYTENNCLDFSVFKPLITEFSDSSLILCSGNAQQFCALTNTVMVWYAVGFASSILVCLGLVQFIASNAANYAHIGGERRYSEIQEILLSETCPNTNFTSIASNGNSYNNGKFPTSKLGDFQVDSYPMQGYNGTLQKRSVLGSAYFPQGTLPQYDYNSQPNPMMNEFNNNPVMGTRKLSAGMIDPSTLRPSYAVGNAVNSTRRNSYHNSLHDGVNLNGFSNTMY